MTLATLARITKEKSFTKLFGKSEKRFQNYPCYFIENEKLSFSLIYVHYGSKSKLFIQGLKISPVMLSGTSQRSTQGLITHFRYLQGSESLNI